VQINLSLQALVAALWVAAAEERSWSGQDSHSSRRSRAFFQG